jgi:hypothetical protein
MALRWLVLTGGSDDLPGLTLVTEDGTRAELRSLLNAPQDWQAGALVVQPYTFHVPKGFAYLETQLDDWTCRLPMRATAAPPPVANFGNQIRLRSYEYASRTLNPGGTVRLTLNWEAVTTIGESYKVFVHVLGPHGLPIAQQDNEPVNGTYPTTRWQRGERISDPYAFALPHSLPPGEYRVEVGLYLPSDFSRLPVLDRELNVIDDKVFLEPLIVE